MDELARLQIRYAQAVVYLPWGNATAVLGVFGDGGEEGLQGVDGSMRALHLQQQCGQIETRGVQVGAQT
jgi:hypothetical protein